MRIYKLIAKALFMLAFATGCSLMAQSLASGLNSAPQNNPSDLSSAVSGSVNGSSNSAVSASVNASAGSTVNATEGASDGSSRGSEGNFSLHRAVPSGQGVNLRGERGLATGASTAALDKRNFGNPTDQTPRNTLSGMSRFVDKDKFRARVSPSSGASGYVSAISSLRARLPSEASRPASVMQANPELPAKYTDNFPDSTEGTALVSPPDLGTQSPLEWSPSLSFEFVDFERRSFLNPSLHVTGRRGRRNGRSGKRENTEGFNLAMPTSIVPSSPGLSMPANSIPDSLSQPNSQSLLDQSLGPQ